MSDPCLFTERIIITHGTDTMIETAKFLASRESLANTRRIVLTGSMRPERFSNTDAPLNVGSAIAAVQILPNTGVYVTMHGVVREAQKAARDDSGQFI
mmetsp:Transcript_10328/g.24897  ORF Transcript_10328/g.24897 Transcript_10328/m.24897 type:complete len:98 (+) Transcript_10328:301-594(+)